MKLHHTQPSTRVLIIEANKDVFHTLKEVLSTEGFNVLPQVENGEMALRKVGLYQPNLVLINCELPGQMNGAQTASLLLSTYFIPVVYISAQLDNRLLEQMSQPGLAGYLTYPLTSEKILSTVQLALYKFGMDQKVRAQEELLGLTLHSLPDAVFSLDIHGVISYVNQAAINLSGLSKTDLEGKPFYRALTLVDRFTRQPIAGLDGQLIASRTGLPDHQTVILVKPDQTVRLVQPQICYTHNSNGILKGCVLLLRDIQDQFLAEEKIRMMAGALENLGDAVIITEFGALEESLVITYVNKAFEKITGWSQEKSLGSPFSLLHGPKTDLSQSIPLRTHITEGKSFSSENIYYRSDASSFIAHQVVGPVRDSQGQATQLVFVIRDISEARKMELRVRQAQKMEAIGRLAGGFAHDFNNLLSIIHSYSDMVKLSVQESPTLLKYMNNIASASQRGASLVEQLMTFSRQSTHIPVPLNLNTLIQGNMKILERALSRNVALKLNLSPQTHWILSSASEVEQVLINLVMNASDAVPPEKNGLVTVCTCNRRIQERCDLQTGALEPGDYVLLTIKDNGKGVDPSMIETLFDPFATTKDVGQGVGLGLSCVYGILKQAQGEIQVKSRLGRGTQFDLYFPALKKPHSSSKRTPPQAT